MLTKVEDSLAFSLHRGRCNYGKVSVTQRNARFTIDFPIYTRETCREQKTPFEATIANKPQNLKKSFSPDESEINMLALSLRHPLSQKVKWAIYFSDARTTVCTNLTALVKEQQGKKEAVPVYWSLLRLGSITTKFSWRRSQYRQCRKQSSTNINCHSFGK